MLPSVTYAATKFEVALSNGLGGAFTRKYIILSLTLTFGQTDGRRTDFGTKLIFFFSKEKGRYNK